MTSGPGRAREEVGADGEGPEVVHCNCGCHAANDQQQEVLQSGSEKVVAMAE